MAASSEQYGLGEPRVLEKIDKLFACGVGEQVDLPLVVVVGDQSSGKSSVLEGLIKKPLPRDSGLCTRHATQIVFRRSPAQQILLSIIPARDAQPEHIARMKAWRHTVPTLDAEAFAELMHEVQVQMGIVREDDLPAPDWTFSNDVLRLEISGPDQEHLSVVDVPGIFKSTTPGLTTKTDIELVKHMVKGYMDNPRCVMLAVIPANVDVATQEILELANDCDPGGDRTLGVLTKPDLVDKGAESRVVDLLDGRARAMKLGWHVLRNPGQSEMSDTGLDRDALEMNFFRSRAPWSGVDKDKVGIDALRVRLKDVLSSLVKREFPKVRAEIKARSDDRRARLASLGPERAEPGEQSAHLTKLATDFQRLVSLAQNTNHGADEAFNTTPDLRIAPQAMARMQVYSDQMADMGHTYKFLGADGGKQADGAPEIETADCNTEPGTEASDQEESMSVRQLHDCEEIAAILHDGIDVTFPQEDGIKAWLNQVFQDNRGFELGTFNPTILATAMKKQSEKWRDISLGYVSDVIVMVHQFVVAALEAVCPEARVRDALFQTILDELSKRYQKALDSANFLLKVERAGAPLTLNPDFIDNLQKFRRKKIAAKFASKAFETPKTGGKVVALSKLVQADDISSDEQVVQDIHDIVQAYYKVSRETFVDNVCRQATKHFLLESEDGPLALFSPLFVARLSATELEEIAGEQPEVRRARIQLKKELGSLDEAMRILARA